MSVAAGIPSGVYGHPTHVSRETASMVPWVFLRVLTAPVSLRLSAGMKRAPPYECVAARSADVYGDPCVQSAKGDVGEEGSGPEARKRSGHAAGPASWEVRREWASHAPLVAWTRRTYGGRQPPDATVSRETSTFLLTATAIRTQFPVVPRAPAVRGWSAPCAPPSSNVTPSD